MRFYQRRVIQQLQLSTGLKQWLIADGSLTQQLTQLSNGQFHVIPINEHYQRLSQIDAMWLNMPEQHIAWVRESHLYGSDDMPWVSAKSIFPILSLNKQACPTVNPDTPSVKLTSAMLGRSLAVPTVSG